MHICCCAIVALGFIVSGALIVTNAQQQQCGETRIESRGELQSLNYPRPLASRVTCRWTFNLNVTDLVYLNVVDIKLTPGDNFSIFDGISTSDYNETNVSEISVIILSPNGSSITLAAGDNKTTPFRRFMASYTTANADNFIYTMDHSGWIRAPKYSPRNAYAIFNWVITQPPDTSIYLSFNSFNINEGSLKVDGGETFTHTGSVIPNDFVTSVANVRLSLNMSLNVPNSSFTMHFLQTHPGCSRVEKIENATDIVINFNEPAIPTPLRCFVIVEGPPGTVLSVGLQPSVTGLPDANTLIELNDGGSHFSRNLQVYSLTSEYEAPPNVITSSNKLWIGYLSVPARQKPLSVKVLITVHNNGSSLRDNGNFTLHQQPENVTLFSNTSAYILTVKSDQQVVTKIQPNPVLGSDSSIFFYDGATSEKLLVNFTADSALYEVISNDNQMLIVANNFEGNETFTASFSGFPKGRNSLSTEQLGSYQVNSIEAKTSYFWIISPLEANSSEVIALTLGTLQLPRTVSLLIYNATSEKAENLVYNLSTPLTNRVIQTPALNGARVVLKNYANESAVVVVDSSYRVERDCIYVLNLTSGGNATFTSPYFPNFYPSNVNCSWLIISNKSLLITFDELNVPPTQPIRIYSISNSSAAIIADVSGYVQPDDIITNRSMILITFLSLSPVDNFTVATGFKITVHTLDCGGGFQATSGEFKTPSFPKSEMTSLYCVWQIVVPAKKGDDAQIINMTFVSGDEKTSSGHLEIHEGGSIQSQSANMSSVNSTGFLSRTNKLLVHYEYIPNKNAGGTSYKFTYDTYLCSPEHQCKNGLCLHDSWRCNGVNDCGDYSDESYCAQSPIAPSELSSSGTVSVATFVVVMFLMLLIGAGIAIGGPIVWRKVRTNRNYQEFRNSADA